jgi:hypothetical protein
MMSQGTLRVAAGTAVLLGLAGGIAAYEYLSEPPTIRPFTAASPTTKGSALENECVDQYTQLSANLSDVPETLPTPVIDLFHGTAEFRLYATPVTPDTRQIIFDCSAGTTGTVTANLTASPGVGTDALGAGAPSTDGDDAYYRDYLPDGSGALVGVALHATGVTTTLDGPGTVPDATFTSGYFVVWATESDILDAVHVTAVNSPGDQVPMDAPTTVSGTYSADALLDACNRREAEQVKLAADEDTRAILQISHDDSEAYIYAGTTTAVCTFDGSQHVGGYSFYTDRPPAGKLVYGMRTYVGGGGGIVTGRVPKDSTSVVIINGPETIDANVANGVFAAWIPAHMFTDRTKVVATVGSHTYTYTGSGIGKPG